MKLTELINKLIKIRNEFDNPDLLEISLMQEIYIKNDLKETMQVESELKDLALVTSYKKGKPIGGSRVVLIGNEID